MSSVNSSGAVGADRRTEPRQSCDVAVMVCRDTRGSAFVSAQMTDRSEHGVCVILPNALHPGEPFLLKLRNTALNVSLYNTVHCKPLDSGKYQVGAKLVRVVGEHPTGS